MLSTGFEYIIDAVKGNPKKRAEESLKSAEEALKSIRKSLSKLEKAATIVGSRKGEIIVTGIGKPGYIGQKIAATLTSLGHRAMFLHPAEALHGDIGVLSSGDALIALSYSGESKEVVKLVEYAKKHFSVSVISFTKSKSSSLGRLSDEVVDLHIKKEGSPENLAPMASTVAMLVLGDMLASMLTEAGFKSHFVKAHPGGTLGLENTNIESIMKSGSHMPIVREVDSAKIVLKEMSSKKLGVTAVINSKKKLAGIITDGDIRRWLIAGGDPKKDIAQIIMTKSPKTLSPHSNLKEALKIMEDYRITTLFVTDNNFLRGVVHIHDIVEGNII